MHPSTPRRSTTTRARSPRPPDLAVTVLPVTRPGGRPASRPRGHPASRSPDLATADLATADLATADLATADLATADLPCAVPRGQNAKATPSAIPTSSPVMLVSCSAVMSSRDVFAKSVIAQAGSAASSANIPNQAIG